MTDETLKPISVGNCPKCNHFPTQFIDVDGEVEFRAISLNTRTTEAAEPQTGRWYNGEDIDRLVRELDVALNGEAGAAKQAKLCDIVAQVKGGGWKLVKELEAREPVAVWRNVRGFKDSYEVSCFGDIRNKRTGKALSKSLAGAGYVKADLYVNGSVKQTYVHRVVADAFLGPIPDGYEINHLNGVKTDNRVDNLEITNRSRNETHKNRVLGQKGKMIFATRISDGKVFRFFSIMECEEILGLTTDKVRQCLTGYRNSHKGWTFEEAPTTPPDDEAVTGFAKMASGFMEELAVEMQRLTGSVPGDDPFELRGEVLSYLRSLPDTEARRLLERVNKETFSQVDGRDLFAELHPRKTLDIVRRVDGKESWHEADWLTGLYEAIEEIRAYLAQTDAEGE